MIATRTDFGMLGSNEGSFARKVYQSHDGFHRSREGNPHKEICLSILKPPKFDLNNLLHSSEESIFHKNFQAFKLSP